MAPDDLAAFRAAHPSVKAALEHCPRPDWAIRLAFDASQDRKAVIAHGVNAARYIRNAGDVIAMMTPAPTPYEALDRWSGNEDSLSRSLSVSRAIIVATMFGVPLTLLIDRYATGAVFVRWGIRLFSAQPMAFVIVIVLAAIIKLSITAAVRLQASRLDECSALERVLQLIERGTKRRPRRAMSVIKFLRLHLPRLVDVP